MTPRFPNHSIKHPLSTQHSVQRGGMLIEGLVSVLLISLAAIAVVGMQTHAIRTDNHAQYRHAAALVVADLANEMLLKRQAISAAATGTWSAHLARLPNAKLKIEDSADALSNYWVKDITITWLPPSNRAAKAGEEPEPDTLSTRITIPKASS